MSEENTVKKLTGGIIVVVILALSLCITTFALMNAVVEAENIFTMGSVKINLNDGKPIITKDDYLFEPGMTVNKDFFVENQSTIDVYYRVYFDEVSGGLADILQITIKEKDSGAVLCSGTANELSKLKVSTADDVLKIGEKRELTVSFYFPQNEDNKSQNWELGFTICAEATQMANNPGKLFD